MSPWSGAGHTFPLPDPLAAALGVGIGTVIRNQVGAVIAVLSLLYVAEPLLGFIPHLGPAVQTYGLGGLASGATGTTGFPASAPPPRSSPSRARPRWLRPRRPATRRCPT
jgi:hypothetical protein